MGFLAKIGKAKAKISAWNEEREQKEYERMKIQSKIAKEYNKRDAEKKKLQKEISKAEKARFENSFLGKTIRKVQDFDDRVNNQGKGKKKGKKPKIKRDNFDMFGDQDPWS